ncbi:hypothetical protein AcW1_005497 [Taiwanofungus camphoratus]|nr:hypothetical protein AcW1_005497 [Antrodia cinnamomea]
MPVLVISNPACGDRTAPAFVSAHVLPLLSAHAITPAAVLATEHPGHAAALVAHHLAATDDPTTVILASGDGTLHEIVDALATAPPPRPLNFALVPCGTANALYASLFPPADGDGDAVEYKLRSVRAFATRGTTAPLALALTTLVPPPTPAPTPPRTAISAVVASTSLHAAILADSEALRASIPGLARFQTAAAQNIARWYRASATLLPARGTRAVELFDARSGRFAPHPHSTPAAPAVALAGPFAYFLSTVNADRLEPAFRIAPHARSGDTAGEGEGAALHLVVVRPRRDPALAADADTDDARAAFAHKTAAVLRAAYADGAHVRMRYARDGTLLHGGDGDGDDEGAAVVEYFRVGGWEWKPDSTDDRAHLVCADGDILRIEPGGKAVCTVVAPADAHPRFAVYV